MVTGAASGSLFVLGDGDRVRIQVERRLLEADLRQLSMFSSGLAAAIDDLARVAQEQHDAEIIMAGGDDVLLRFAAETFTIDKLRDLSLRFASASGCSISFGVGSTVEAAYVSLRRAKAAGGGTIVVAGNKP